MEKRINEAQLSDLLPGVRIGHRTDTQSRQEWVEGRMRSIGASDVAAMLGCSPWVTELELAVRKRGGEGSAENRAMQRGTQMEPLIRRWVEEDTGCPIYTVPFQLLHRETTVLSANLDGLGVDGDGRPFVVEIKDSSHGLDVYQHIADHGIPPRDSVGTASYGYWLQVQSQLAITGCDLACFAVADRADLHIYWWRPSEEIQGYLLDVAPRWWRKHVLDRVDPAATGRDLALLRSLCPPDDSADAVDLSGDPEATRAMETYEAKRAERLALEKEVKVIADAEADARAQLEQMMGSAPAARVGDREATRKTVERAGYTVDPSSYVRFGTRKAKRVKS